MMIDARTNPDLAEQFKSTMHAARYDEVRGVVRRAVQRGGVRPTATVGSALQTLIGGTLSHFLLNPGDDPPADHLSAADERFLRRLVDSLVA
jgi:hypothetical protein